MENEYATFLAVTGALARLVIIATVLERGLAFIFEHDWFIRLTTIVSPDPKDSTKSIRQSRIPGLKGILALAGSLAICFAYRFDILHVLFQIPESDTMGIIVTGFVVAGGSAGAIAIFQAHLNISKESRDARIAARKAQAEAAKHEAELVSLQKKMDILKIETAIAEAEARKKVAGG